MRLLYQRFRRNTDALRSPGTSELLKASFKCAAMVYDQTQQFGPKGFDIEPVLHRTPSSMGTAKASSMWKIPFTPVPGWAGKTLVVSIKGTSTIADHMVNMNGKSKDASALFVRTLPLLCFCLPRPSSFFVDYPRPRNTHPCPCRISRLCASPGASHHAGHPPATHRRHRGLQYCLHRAFSWRCSGIAGIPSLRLSR